MWWELGCDGGCLGGKRESGKEVVRGVGGTGSLKLR